MNELVKELFAFKTNRKKYLKKVLQDVIMKEVKIKNQIFFF